LFAGQGAEEPRMGLDLAQHSTRARALLDYASDVVSVDLAREIARGGRALARTEVLQAAMTAISLGAWESLRERDVDATLCAGHSLGELCAWAAAANVPSESAIDIAVARGRAMADAASLRPGGMLALTSADESTVEQALALGGTAGAVALAAHNAPSEWVLSGDDVALRTVERAFGSTRIASAGPWHSPVMAAASEAFRAAFGESSGASLARGLVSAVTGRRVTDATEAIARLVEGLTAPVRWVDALRALRDASVTHFVIAGPGRVLRGLLRKNFGADVAVTIVDDADSVARFVFG
jgi:[acyl-carrier-protein] S-malonyltransferase